MQKTRSIVTPERVAKSASILVGIAVISYFLFRLLPVFLAPRLTVSGPLEAVVTDPEYVLQGNVDARARLSANHEELYVDGGGNFKESMWLASGLNVIDVAATGRFGRTTKITKYIIYKH